MVAGAGKLAGIFQGLSGAALWGWGTLSLLCPPRAECVGAVPAGEGVGSVGGQISGEQGGCGCCCVPASGLEKAREQTQC